MQLYEKASTSAGAAPILTASGKPTSPRPNAASLLQCVCGSAGARFQSTNLGSSDEETTMRLTLTVGCILLLWHITARLANEPPQSIRIAKASDPSLEAILREASEITLKQDAHRDSRLPGSRDQVLLEIVELQIRAGDFNGALESIGGCNDPDYRNTGLFHIAEALARDGNGELAFDIVRMVGSDWRPNPFDTVRWRFDPEWQAEDDIQRCWFEHLVASGDLGAAANSLQRLKSTQIRIESLQKLAVAYSKSGAQAQATGLFKLAIDAALPLENEFARLEAFQEIADAQLDAGRRNDAMATIRFLLDTIEFKNSWAKFLALLDSAVLAAKANDRQAAGRLFERAIETRRQAGETVGVRNEIVAVAQAGAGYIDDARKTGSEIAPREGPRYDFAPRHILCAIADAQWKSGDVAGAIHSILSVEHDVEQRDEKLEEIVDCLIAKKDLKTALSMAEKIQIRSWKAASLLKVATAHARSGARSSAIRLAARMDLDVIRGYERGRPNRFDYRNPRSWGTLYEFNGLGSARLDEFYLRSAAKVAAAAMTFSQAIGQVPAPSYAISFNDDSVRIIQALARAHAASGDAGEALTWAKRIGSDAIANAYDDNEMYWAINRGAQALIGVAEGVLDRSSDHAKVMAVP
jgi:hypothetical protein